MALPMPVVVLHVSEDIGNGGGIRSRMQGAVDARIEQQRLERNRVLPSDALVAEGAAFKALRGLGPQPAAFAAAGCASPGWAGATA